MHAGICPGGAGAALILSPPLFSRLSSSSSHVLPGFVGSLLRQRGQCLRGREGAGPGLSRLSAAPAAPPRAGGTARSPPGHPGAPQDIQDIDICTGKVFSLQQDPSPAHRTCQDSAVSILGVPLPSPPHSDHTQVGFWGVLTLPAGRGAWIWGAQPLFLHSAPFFSVPECPRSHLCTQPAPDWGDRAVLPPAAPPDCPQELGDKLPSPPF